MVVTLLGQQYNTGEKLTIMLYTYALIAIAGTSDKNKTNKKLLHDKVGL